MAKAKTGAAQRVNAKEFEDPSKEILVRRAKRTGSSKRSGLEPAAGGGCSWSFCFRFENPWARVLGVYGSSHKPNERTNERTNENDVHGMSLWGRRRVLTEIVGVSKARFLSLSLFLCRFAKEVKARRRKPRDNESVASFSSLVALRDRKRRRRTRRPSGKDYYAHLPPLTSHNWNLYLGLCLTVRSRVLYYTL